LNAAPRIPLGLCIAGLLVPTIITFVYFVLLEDSQAWTQKTAYVLGKSLQVATLVAACIYWHRQRRLCLAAEQTVRLERRRAQLAFGVSSGLVIAITMLALFFGLLNPMGVMKPVEDVARAKLFKLGGESPWTLLAIAVFYSVFHSGFEELYWRGFVFRGLREHLRDAIAVTVSSIGFMAHHVLVLGQLFGYGSLLTYAFSAGVAVGGILWAVTYLRSQSLLPGWLSHALVDAAIFGIGFFMIFKDGFAAT
jgi:membrane protease YdiL (CAAX protease family)